MTQCVIIYFCMNPKIPNQTPNSVRYLLTKRVVDKRLYKIRMREKKIVISVFISELNDSNSNDELKTHLNGNPDNNQLLY